MLSMLTACTAELDDAERAVEELLGQLDLDNNLRSNAVGVVTCCADCLEAGIMPLLRERAPFDIVGGTALMTGSGGERGDFLLQLAVLTGDDVEFSAAMAPLPDAEGSADSIAATCRAAMGGRGDAPALILAFMPLNGPVSGDAMLDALSAAAGGAPIFGTVVSDYHDDYAQARVIMNGECAADGMAMALVFGDVEPSFLVMHVSDEKVQRQKAVITQAQDNVIMAINDMNAMEYMRTIGLSEGDGFEGVAAIPLLVDYQDGARPVARAMLTAIMPQGYIKSGGAMTRGATFAIGHIDYDDIVATAGRAAGEILASGKRGGAILFPCMSRVMALGADATAEMEALDAALGGALPYMIGYAGGEICPVRARGGALVNRFHNFSLVACVF